MTTVHPSRAFRLGIAGPVGSGKTALVDRLSQRLWPRYSLAVVTNDIYTKEDAEFLLRQGTLPAERVRGVETGACTAGTSYCLTFDNNNRINSGAQTYDAAGNVMADSMHHYFYDAENRLIQVDGTLGTCTGATTACYVYDANGRRVQKTTPTGTVNYVYDIAGEQVAEVNSSGVLNRAEVYAAGTHLATYTNSTTYFDHGDWLGTERARTTVAGTIYETCTSLPFGDGMNCTGADASPMHFTGKERDGESGLDNFEARYFGSGLGRFMSPDPLLNSGRPWDPQTWNRYAYAQNNPLNIVDPTGLYDLVNNCATDNKKCNKQFRKHARDLKNGLSNLQKQVNRMKDGPEKDRLEASLTVLGTQGDNNGVNVTFAALAPGTAGHTTFDVNPDTLQVTAANITLDPNQISGLNSYAIDTAHEGTHIEDLLTGLLSASGVFSLPQLGDFSTEYRGYETSAYAARALGVPSLSFGGNVIWNQSWRAADQQTLMDKGTTRVVTGPPYNYQETTPHNPWPN